MRLGSGEPPRPLVIALGLPKVSAGPLLCDSDDANQAALLLTTPAKSKDERTWLSPTVWATFPPPPTTTTRLPTPAAVRLLTATPSPSPSPLSPSPSHPHPRPSPPKAGTTSLGEYFACHGWHVSHFLCTPSHLANTTLNSKCALCFQDWLSLVASREHPGSRGWREQLDLSADLRNACGPYDVFAELNLQLHNVCLYPQITHLHTLIRVLPHACFVLNTRPLPNWLESLRQWGAKTLTQSHAASYQPERDTLLAKMLNSCPIHPRTEQGVMDWHAAHLTRVRDALRNHSCALEIDVEDPSTGPLLQNRFPGTRASCWARHNQQSAYVSARLQARQNHTP